MGEVSGGRPKLESSDGAIPRTPPNLSRYSRAATSAVLAALSYDSSTFNRSRAMPCESRVRWSFPRESNSSTMTCPPEATWCVQSVTQTELLNSSVAIVFWALPDQDSSYGFSPTQGNRISGLAVSRVKHCTLDPRIRLVSAGQPVAARSARLGGE